MDGPLSTRVALVAGGTRGAGRGIAVELGAAGATVYVTGRTTEASASPMGRPETIEETARLVDAAGGTGIAVRVDHSRPEEVRLLTDRIAAEQGSLDILVNDIWGGDPLAEWGVAFWDHELANGIALLRGAVETHLVTSWHAVPLMIGKPGGLVVEVTDGVGTRYRGSLFYDLAKASAIRLALAQGEELRSHGIAAVAVSPGFLRSEAMLDLFGVTEATWRDGIAKDPHFAFSETPRYLGRAVAALAADPDKMARTGTATATWELYGDYGFTDVDGTQPDWGRHARDDLGWEP
jgi:NAD(P)-dependent dehydrogenase (short-subunit alcohol dehydrogenase family)